MNRRRPSLSAVPAVLGVLAIVLAACSQAGESPSAEASDGPSAAASVPEASQAEASEAASAAPSEAEAATERVRLTTSQFDPTELTIAAGTEVLFLNASGFDHTVTEGTGGQPVDDPIVDEEIAANGTVQVTFDEPGTYEITCRIHPTMQLTITVEG